jgi:bacterioferritin (cytochrome b1)
MLACKTNAENDDLIESLNRMLAQEHACAIRHATHAAVVEGPWSEPVAARLEEIAGDEVLHA